MLVSLTVGKVDAGVTVLLTPDKRLIEFPSILLPPDISSGSIVDITVARNLSSEAAAEKRFQTLQDQIFASFGSASPTTPVLRCRNATQTSVVLEWDPIQLATADLISLALFRNGQKAGNIPRPLQMHSTKISGLAVDTEYSFHLVLRTSAGTYSSERVTVRTHKMTDLSGITITTGILPASTREALSSAVDRIGAKIVDSVRIDTTHFVTTEGRGIYWEKAVEMNIPVVRPEWVEACEKNGRILGVTKFYLDALRPGPPSEDRPTTSQQQPAPTPPAVQSPTEKELPAAPAGENGEGSSSSSKEAEEEKAATTEDNGAQRKEEGADNNSDDSDSDQEEEQEAKTKLSGHGEQKVRFEDKEQNLTLRPGGPSFSKSATVEDGDDDDDKIPATPGDRSSFQEISL